MWGGGGGGLLTLFSSLSAILYRGRGMGRRITFRTSHLRSCKQCPYKKGSSLKGKNLFICFPFRVDAVSEGDKIILIRVISLEMYQFPLN